MLTRFRLWLAGSRNELTQVAVEQDVAVDVPAELTGRQGPVWLRLRGRVDRLESDRDGRPVIVDVKTGRNPPTEREAADHPQLAVYQLAAALGAFGEFGLNSDPGGACLLYVAAESRGRPKVLSQPPMDTEKVREWLDSVVAVATTSAGTVYPAVENADCDRCPARPSCPLHASGRQTCR
jgi:RecB family exonuclease